MKRTKYGKSAQKTIYIPPNTEDHKTWEEIVDYSTNRGEGVGSVLMSAWRKIQKAQNIIK